MNQLEIQPQDLDEAAGFSYILLIYLLKLDVEPFTAGCRWKQWFFRWKYGEICRIMKEKLWRIRYGHRYFL